MATNHYFNHYGTNTADQRLLENIIIESIKVYGIDVNYMPRTLVNEDKIFGEDRISQFNDSRVLEVSTITKLVRNTFLIVMIPLFAYFYSRNSRTSSYSITTIFPFFVLAFI